MAKQFHLLFSDESQTVRSEAYDTHEDLGNRLKVLLDPQGPLIRQLFVIHGERWTVSSSAHGLYFLIPPSGLEKGNTIPLFDAPKPVAADPDGFVGEPDPEPEPQYAHVTEELISQATPPAVEEEEPDADDPFSDD